MKRPNLVLPDRKDQVLVILLLILKVKLLNMYPKPTIKPRKMVVILS